jgi:hypothetical protein
LSHEERDAPDGAAAAKAREKVPNEANLQSTQDFLANKVKSFLCESADRKRSQFTQAVARADEAATVENRVASED